MIGLKLPYTYVICEESSRRKIAKILQFAQILDLSFYIVLVCCTLRANRCKVLICTPLKITYSIWDSSQFLHSQLGNHQSHTLISTSGMIYYHTYTPIISLTTWTYPFDHLYHVPL